MFPGETITNEGFLIKKNQHTPRQRQNRDHTTNEEIRDHHNKKKPTKHLMDPKTSTQIHTGKHSVDHINKQTPQMDHNYPPL